MRTRATSAVIDAAVFLLLVTAAVGTLALPVADERPSAPPEADDSVEMLATATASVTYSLAPGARLADRRLVAFPTKDGPAFDRAAHGTLAGLLANAAVWNVSVAGVQVTHTTDDFERAVERHVTNATRRRVAVRAVWTPYRGSPVRGVLTAGTPPPRDATVATATLTVPSGVPAVRERARLAARRDGYAGVARVLTRATIRGLFPPDGVRLALRGDYPVDSLVTYRYLRFARLTGTTIEPPTPATVAATNERLARALAVRFETDLRRSYPTPAAAARATRTGEVHIVVRTWAR